MCGIAGIVDLSGNPIDRALVENMCEVMARRGPDADGLKALPHAVLGHRRLAILDLSAAGNQPMSNPEGTLWVVFNGEIYNHRELRSELEARGYRFRTRTDTEALIYGYEVWGQGLSARLRGMWAFAIWDVQKQSLFLSRDRLGEKPLFYCQEGSRFIFASSLPAISKAMNRTIISPEAVASLLAYEYIPTDECIYEGVRKLSPANHLVVNRSGTHLEPYWQVDYRHKLDISPTEAERLIEEKLSSAISEQLVADVPVGVFLSGGVDSGLVTALASQKKPGITTFTMSVPGSIRDESGNARRVAETHHTKHIEVPLDQGCIRDLPSLLAFGEPFADSSIIPAAAVAKEVSKFLKVVLTGDGGDEAFGGYGFPTFANQAKKYSRYHKGMMWRAFSRGAMFLAHHPLTPGLRLFGPFLDILKIAGLEAFVSMSESTLPQVRGLLYGPKLRPIIDRPVGAWAIRQLKSCNYSEWWDAGLALGLVTRLSGDFLVKVDTATMFHSIESRCPFLDYRIIELSAQLPLSCWLLDGETKPLLKRLASKYNPREVVYSPKKGFSIPVDRYFLGSWGQLLINLTKDGVAAQLGLLNPQGIRKYLGYHGLRCRNRLDRQLFSILCLEIWLRVFHTKSQDPEALGELFYQGVRDN